MEKTTEITKLALRLHLNPNEQEHIADIMFSDIMHNKIIWKKDERLIE